MMTHTNPPISSETTLHHLWRDALDRWTEPCLQCLWPKVHEKIDWSKPTESLQWTSPETAQGIEIAGDTDLIYKISLLKGNTSLIWIHIAYQADSAETLAIRLFQLSYQLYVYYQQPILPLVLVLESQPDWKSQPYQADALGYPTHRFEFQAIQLNHWLNQEDTLLSSDNPFENIMAIYLKARYSSKDFEKRYQLKLKLHNDLIQKKKTKEEFLDLYTFIDRWIPLPEALNKRYHEAVYELERKKQVDYLITTKQFGIDQWIQKGFQEGIEQANQKHLKRMLSTGIERSTIKSILRITDIELNRLLILANNDSNDSFQSMLET